VPGLFARSVPAYVRAVGLAAAGGLALLASAAALAQSAPPLGVFAYKWNAPIPKDMITPGDIQQGLIWTGHLAVPDGSGSTAIRKATQAWQAAKQRPLTETLPDDQAVELVSEGLKKRDETGWAILHDDAVGFAVGIPSNLAKLSAPQSDGSTLWYNADGTVCQSVGVRYGGNCGMIRSIYASLLRKGDSYRARTDGGFTIISSSGDSKILTRGLCHPGGIIMTVTSVSNDRPDLQRALFAATMASTSISATFNPSARPRPKITELPPAPMDGADRRVAARPRSADTAPKNVDTAGMTDRLKLVRRQGGDLRAEEVFEKVGAAVYMVKVDKGIGSAVAVSESDLLTNCHVVGDQTQVLLVRDKQELKATVVSMNVNADRCVLRTEAKLPKWVGVRPYSDIKVGERALTIGTPAGLELTVAEGIVSSKRSQNDSKLVQTTAPISPGSSGGGLFDAQGELLGITTFYFKGGQNLNFAVAAEEFARPDGQPE